MAKISTVDHTRRLEDAGLNAQQATVLVEVMEDIVGTPLTKELFEAKSETLTASLLAKLDLFSAEMRAFKVEMTSFKDFMEKSVASLKTEAELRQQALDQSMISLKAESALRQEAFEKSIEASIAKGRLATLTGIWVIATGVIVLVIRAYLSGLQLP